MRANNELHSTKRLENYLLAGFALYVSAFAVWLLL